MEEILETLESVSILDWENGYAVYIDNFTTEDMIKLDQLGWIITPIGDSLKITSKF